MPPAVVTGMAVGAGEWEMAGSALLLLAVNVVCLNVSSQLVLIWKGIHARTFLEKRAASTAVRTNLAVWGVLMAMLAALVTIGVVG